LKKQNFLISLLISIGIVICSLLGACSSVDVCPDNPAYGNSGKSVNSSQDELGPYIFDREMIYTVRDKKTSDFKIYSSLIKQNNLTPSLPLIDKEINSLKGAGLMKIYRKPVLGTTYSYFAALSQNSITPNSDIFFSLKDANDKWTTPKSAENINSEYFESYPSLSHDGDIIVFASDRPDGYGGIDLYVSSKNSEGNWSKPLNLGNGINTEGDEISPFICNDGSLMYSSNGLSADKTFDIYIASDELDGNWNNPHKLPSPINSKFNEISASVFDNMIYLSSDRPGGCGNYDIYSFVHCGDVLLEGTVEGETPEIPLEGKLYLLNSDREVISISDINSDGKFVVNLSPSNIYYLRYFNNCVPNYVPEQKIAAPCSDSTVVKMIAKFIIPEGKKKFDFANYKVPFFVSGYYHPNTPTSLENLRLKFAYNLIGNDEGSRYIEEPSEIYDDYSLIVKQALDEVVEHINKMLEAADGECIASSQRFVVKVYGFADPRSMSEFSIYNEENINDSVLDFQIEKGDKINNILLSQLRAYFTARYIMTRLKSMTKVELYKLVKWEIEGLGIDESEETSNELKRRVNVEIGLSDN